MLKALSRLWMKGLERVGRTGRKHTTKLLKTLLKPPKAVVPVEAKAIPQLKLKRTPGTDALRIVPAVRRQSVARPAISPLARIKPAVKKPLTVVSQPRPKAIEADGNWTTSFHNSTSESGLLPARRMAYYLYLPKPPLAPAVPLLRPEGLPLIVMLHGCEQTAAEFAQGTRMNLWAQRKGYAVLYPQQAIRAHANRCWKWYEESTQNGGGDVELIIGMIHKIVVKYGIDPRRVYIAGLSAGAAMAHIVALNHPQLFAAIALHSGPVFGAGHSRMGAYGVMQQGASMRASGAITELLNKRPELPALPTMLIQGMADQIVRPVNQTQLIEQCLLFNRMSEASARPAVAKPAARKSKAYELRDYVQGRKLMVRTVKIEGLDHAWSGGDEAAPYNCAAAPDASKMLVEFFAKHRRMLARSSKP